MDIIIDKTVQVALFGLDQAITLFMAYTEEHAEEMADKAIGAGLGAVGTAGVNSMDKMLIYSGLQKKGLSKYIDLRQAAERAVKEIENLSTVFEAHDFGTALDYLSDAWRALSGKNIPLFKESINDAYKSARISKTKITKNPSHLLGVYSIIIFCGFCKFSNYGERPLLGLQHIKDTLNEMSAGSGSQSLLNKTLTSITKSSRWSKDEQLFMKNVVLFGMRVTRLVENMVAFSRRSSQTVDNIEDELDVEFGDVITMIFPNSVISDDEAAKKQDILEYTEWCPAVLEGRYLGGNGTFSTVDFMQKIHPLLTQKEISQNIDVFIRLNHIKIAQYLSTYNDAMKVMNASIKCEEDEEFVAVTAKMEKYQLFEVCLSLQSDINDYFDANNDLDAKQDDDDDDDEASTPKVQKKQSSIFSSKTALLATTGIKIPDKVVIYSYYDALDLSFSSKYCGFNKLEFNGCKQCDIEKFFESDRVKYGLFLQSVKEFGVKNVSLTMSFINEMMKTLKNSCIELKELVFESVTISYDLYDQKNFSNSLNLFFIPNSVETFKYKKIVYVESNAKSDKYDEKLITKVKKKGLGNKRQVIMAIDKVSNLDTLDKTQQYLKTLECLKDVLVQESLSGVSTPEEVTEMDFRFVYEQEINTDDIEAKDVESNADNADNDGVKDSESNTDDVEAKKVESNTDGDDAKDVDTNTDGDATNDAESNADDVDVKDVVDDASKKVLSKIDLSGTVIGKYNLRELLHIVGDKFINMTELTLSNSCITHDFCNLFVDFYEKHGEHSLTVIHLGNDPLDKDYKKNKNVLNTQRSVDVFVSLMKDQLKKRGDVRIILDSASGKMEICANFGVIELTKFFGTKRGETMTFDISNGLYVAHKSGITAMGSSKKDKIGEDGMGKKTQQFDGKILSISGVLASKSDETFISSICVRTETAITMLGEAKNWIPESTFLITPKNSNNPLTSLTVYVDKDAKKKVHLCGISGF